MAVQDKNAALLRVMISSTSRDLPEHRSVVLDACLRQGMFPLMMEHLPASDSDAISESLRMVDQADIYLGIYAFRYGHIPKGHDISITEMEYNRAVERGMPRLVFLIDDDHPIRASDVERGEAAVKLDAFKTRLGSGQIINRFISPSDLQAKVINSLSQMRMANLTTFHYVSDIPKPPDAYVAHPYTLLQAPTLVGRQEELNILTEWVSDPHSALSTVRMLNVVAVGGMGKSALTWEWFQDIAPYEMQPLDGRLWWSFYESDASFEHFVTRALAYMSERSIKEVQEIPKLERENQLFALLDQRPYLVVFDGLERIMMAYTRPDASRLADEDLDRQTANLVAGALGLPASTAQSFFGQHRLRQTFDPNVGTFLRKLTTIRASRILISTRLYPAELQTDSGRERTGCRALFLRGLADDDAVNLWRTFGSSGTREQLLPLFSTFDNHPLLIQALAGVVAHDRRAPGDFDLWRANHSDFNPFQLPLVQARSHVLATALQGLDANRRQVLSTIAAFRMPCTYDTLVALFVGDNKLFDREDILVRALTELEDRGLLGWDRRANRYDLHPIVRGITWNMLGQESQNSIYETLNSHFSSLPEVKEDQVNSLDDLTAGIELYNTLIGLGRYNEAAEVFSTRLFSSMLFRFGAGFQARALLEVLPTQKLERENLIMVLFMMAASTLDSPKKAVELYRQLLQLTEEKDWDEDIISLYVFYIEQLCLAGEIYESERNAVEAFTMLQNFSTQKNEDLVYYALIFVYIYKGDMQQWKKALIDFQMLGNTPSIDVIGSEDFMGCIISGMMWTGRYKLAYELAQQLRKEFLVDASFRNMMGKGTRAIWLHGKAALGLGKFVEAEEYLNEALAQARALNLVVEEIPARIWLAELRRQQGNLRAARELLDGVWEPAERGSFVPYHADAYNVLAQIERDAGKIDEAISAARNAYFLSWCDGPPYVYHWGLQQARAHLVELNAVEPDILPFDEKQHTPISELEAR